MNCVKSVTFSILINGEPHGLVMPSRGLRQDDPLSNFLFLICTMGLITLLVETKKKKELSGIKICERAPLVNHLLFANDSIIFI